MESLILKLFCNLLPLAVSCFCAYCLKKALLYATWEEGLPCRANSRGISRYPQCRIFMYVFYTFPLLCFSL